MKKVHVSTFLYSKLFVYWQSVTCVLHWICAVWFLLDVWWPVSRCWKCNTQLHHAVCNCWGSWQSQKRATGINQQAYLVCCFSWSKFVTFRQFFYYVFTARQCWWRLYVFMLSCCPIHPVTYCYHDISWTVWTVLI